MLTGRTDLACGIEIVQTAFFRIVQVGTAPGKNRLEDQKQEASRMNDAEDRMQHPASIRLVPNPSTPLGSCGQIAVTMAWPK